MVSLMSSERLAILSVTLAMSAAALLALSLAFWMLASAVRTSAGSIPSSTPLTLASVPCVCLAKSLTAPAAVSTFFSTPSSWPLVSLRFAVTVSTLATMLLIRSLSTELSRSSAAANVLSSLPETAFN